MSTSEAEGRHQPLPSARRTSPICVVDDKGNDFFLDPSGAVTVPLSGILVRSAQN